MRVAVVTGAAQGIGQCVALRLAQAGYALALQDLKDLNATLALLPASAAHLTSQSDVTDEAAVEAFATLVRQRWQRADVLVNNAGISCIERATATSAAQFRRVVDVNLTGAFLVARAFGALMLTRRAGSIVNIASIAGLTGIA